MNTIWKFQLVITDCQKIIVPFGSRPLSVINQRGQPCLYMLVDPNKETVQRLVYIFGTGNPIDPEVITDTQFIGTIEDRQFVWHVFMWNKEIGDMS